VYVQVAILKQGEMLDSYQTREYIDAANVTEGGKTNERRNAGQNSCLVTAAFGLVAALA